MGDDDRLRAEVLDELAWDFLVDEARIDVEVHHRVVTLVGTVGSYAEKLVAQNAALSVDGVHDLVNAIDVKPRAELHPSDDQLALMVRQILTWDALVPEHNLDVSVIDGLVAITGTCSTRSQAEEAERVVGRLSGVRDVLNRIDIVTPSPDPEAIRRAITGALARRSPTRVSEVDVVIDRATVTLRGTLKTAAERRAVVAAVTHAPGIIAVRDEIVIG